MTASQRRLNTLIDCLMIGCDTDPHRFAYTVLGDGENESESCTYAGLLTRVQRIAAGLHAQGLRGRTALLLIGNPLRFIEAFFACLWVGAIPVPAAVPRRAQSLDSLRAIAQNAQASVFVTDNGEVQKLWSDQNHSMLDIRWVLVEQLASASPYTSEPAVSPNDTAFLQYTSGSTGSPKGVVVTHANLISNQRAIYQAMQTHQESVFLGWLPLHHDMGLIGNALQPLYATARCVIMSPVAFLQRPVRWLRAISKYRATNSGGPNFAYELCVQKVPVEARTGLDLSSWDVAYNGSEPVRADTIERFCSAFGTFGFRRSAVYPCYGLAESTLLVAGSKPGVGPRFRRVDKAQLENGCAVVTDDACQSVELVSSGEPAIETQVAIVDPYTRKILDDGTIGEIWVSSASVASGYFNQEQESRKQFAAQIAGAEGSRFLRTGDLGFLQDGALYVTGRIKDVIIFRGRNHYAHDLEVTASRSSPSLARGAAAALTIDDENGKSLLYLVCELTRSGWRNAQSHDVAADVREAIAVEHGLQVNRVVLIRPGTLPRTTSGKIRRATCREMILADSFETLGITKTPSVEHVRPPGEVGPT